MRNLITAVLLMAFGASQALANPPEPASPPPPPDRVVKGLNEAVFLQLFQSFGQADNIADRKAGAEKLQTAIRADNVIDAAEADLLSELTQIDFSMITIETPSAAYRQFYVYPARSDAKKILRHTLRPLTDLRNALDSGKEGWTLLVTAYKRDAQSEADALEVLVERMTEVAEQANMANRYQPFRDKIGHYYAFTYAKEGGRDLLHRAAVEADKAVDDKLPDFLYNWVKPAPTP